MIRRLRPRSIIRDLPPAEIPEDAYSNGNNCYFPAQGALSVQGYGDIFNPTLLGSPMWAEFVRAPSQRDFWVYAGTDFVAVTDLVTHWDITPTPLALADERQWQGSVLNSLLMLTNGTDAPYYWPGVETSPIEPLPDWPAGVTCDWIRPYRFFAIAGGINDNGQELENQFYWSASVTPGLPPQSWTPLPSNDAGDAILASHQGAVIDAGQLRDFMILGKTGAMYIMRYIGGQLVMSVTELSGMTGFLARDCFAEWQGRGYIFTDGDMVVTDGQQIQSIATDQVRRTVFDEMNKGRVDLCFVTPYYARNQIWFCYPTGNDEVCTRAAVYSPESGAWGFRNLPNVYFAAEGITQNFGLGGIWDDDAQAWDDDPTVWDQTGESRIADGVMMVSSDDSGHLYALDFERNAAGEPQPMVLLKESMDFENYDAVKIIRRVIPYIFGTPGDVLTVRLGVQQAIEEPIQWVGSRPYVIGQDRELYFIGKGRLISIEITSSGNNQVRVLSIAFDYDEVSRH